MKKIIILSLTAIFLFSASFAGTGLEKERKIDHTAKVKPSAKVYICNSKSAYAYHSSTNCRGLNRCNHGTSGISEADAKAEGKRPCKICY